jgi:enoyl-CoA hydratase/carnithine racemase
MYDALAAALGEAERDPAIRVVTLSGTGDAFTSGNDLNDFLQVGLRTGDSPPTRFLTAISTSSKPLIACVNGLAVGVGVTMLLHCDLVYAADSASFQLPFVNLAVVPEAGSTLLLPRRVGHQHAAELFLLGERFDAATAHRLGLVNAVHPAAVLADEVRRTAAILAAKPPEAVRLTKALLKRDGAAGVAARIAEEAEHFARQVRSPEAREAMEAFLQKRPPDFSRFG